MHEPPKRIKYFPVVIPPQPAAEPPRRYDALDMWGDLLGLPPEDETSCLHPVAPCAWCGRRRSLVIGRCGACHVRRPAIVGVRV